MKAMSWLRGRKGTFAGAAVVTAGAIALTTFAVAYEGNPTAEVELDDGSVWVSKTSTEVIGHLNTESSLLDAQLRGITSDEIRILQTGDEVFVHDRTDNTLSRIDGAAMVLGERVTLETGAQVEQGASTLAIVGEAGLYVLSNAQMGAFSTEEASPLAEVAADTVATVAVDGTVHAFSAETGTLTTVEVTADGEPDGEPTQRTIEGIEPGADVQITTVGETPVILDRTDGYVITPDGLQTSIGTDATMQLAADAPSARSVRVATSNGVTTVPLDGSEPTAVSAGATGEPVTPVVVDGCVYAAWSGANHAARDCAGTENDFAQPLENAASGAELELRANRGEVVINDRSGGASWVASDGLAYVNNWDDLTPPEGDDQESDEVEQSDTTEVQPPDRTQENRPPEAQDDEYGVRAGRSSVLPVLDNDSDPDGDLLTITVEEQPEFGVVQTIQDGKGLQISMPGGAAAGSTASFTYKVEDGRGGSDTARVTVTVHPDDQNAPPEPKELQPTVAVETGGSVTYNVLPDWIDPDGDDIFLAGVAPAEGDEVTFTADGQITYEARSGYVGPLDVDVTISDGDQTATGTLALDVAPVGTVKPVTNGDHAVMFEGDTVTVDPLQNDVNAASEDLRLASVTQITGLDTFVDTQSDTVEITGLEAGTYYLDYIASAGSQSAPGVIRVDVLPSDEASDEPPVAVRDIAYLPGGGEVLVDVLQNDHDPSGGVLVVQSVAAPAGSGVSAAVLGHSTVQIADNAMQGEQVVVRYNIHNGAQGATGEIIVIPVPPTDKIQPPVAEDDTATVRAGDIVTIPVTENDYHPNAQSFSVVPELVEEPDAELGEMFVAQDTVRFRAAEDASGQATAIYEIVDDKGQKSAGLIRVNITPWNESNNSAPVARTVTARAIAGTETRVEIPLDRIDPDGDMVDLVGISSAPTQGRIVERGPDYFTYQAYRDSAGGDSFRYRVSDTFGEEAVGTVDIGIAPPEAVNQPPNAMSVDVAMRPGRTVSVPVIANDSDPDGDKFGLVADGVTLHDEGSGLRAQVSGADRVLVTSPSHEMSTQFQYTIEDEYGNRSDGVVNVTVAEDVPLEAPIARDDRVLIDMVTGDFTADLDLYANDEDPDGTTEDLELSIDGVEPLPGEGPGWVRVAVEDRRQAIPYTVTDPDGGTASAFLIVPAKDELRPVVKEGAEITAPSNELVEIPLEDYVTVADGRDVRITTSDSVSVNHGDGTALVKDETTLQYKSEYRYMGADDITFEVTDGESAEDPNGRKSVITIPINVLQPENEPPEFTNTTMTVGAGDGPVSIDLAARTFDIDEDAIVYSHTNGAPQGVSVSIDGSTLTVDAAPDTRGLAPTIDLSLSDGENDPVSGQVMLSVTASTKPLPGAPDIDLGEIHQGEAQQVGVTGDAFNPFEGEGPLHVVGATLEAGDATVSSNDGSVSITPGASFHGYVTVRYTLGDLTNDPDRYVQGRITATVLGVPDQPGTPQASQIGNRTATLEWRAPSNNGAEITAYEVASTDGSYSTTCRTTVCKLDGLTNNHVYNFTVTAVNEVGPSAASVASSDVRPDVKPEAPAQPRFTLSEGERDQRLGIAWQTPVNEGSPIEGYYVRIEGPNGTTIKKFENDTSTSRVFEGLTNGQSYRFQVAAINRADIRSDDDWSWSPWSAKEYPATVPDAPPSKPTVVLNGDRALGQNDFRLTWPAVEDNGGSPITKWEIEIRRGDEVQGVLSRDNSGNSEIVSVETSEADYTFRVRAVNREGHGEFGERTESVRSYSPPGVAELVSVAPSNSSVKVAWRKADANGARDGELHYQARVNGGTWADITGESRGNGEFVGYVPAENGRRSAVEVRAVTRINATQLGGPVSGPSNPVWPYGPIPQPQFSSNLSNPAAAAHNAKVTVAVPTNGRPIVRAEIRVFGADGREVLYDEWQGETNRFEQTIDVGVQNNGWLRMYPGEPLRVRVDVWDNAEYNSETGQRGSNHRRAGTGDAYTVPVPTFTVSSDNATRQMHLAYEHLIPPDAANDVWGYDYRCEVERDDGRIRKVGDSKLYNGTGAGTVRVECIDPEHFDGRKHRVVVPEQRGIPAEWVGGWHTLRAPTP